MSKLVLWEYQGQPKFSMHNGNGMANGLITPTKPLPPQTSPPLPPSSSSATLHVLCSSALLTLSPLEAAPLSLSVGVHASLGAEHIIVGVGGAKGAAFIGGRGVMGASMELQQVSSPTKVARRGRGGGMHEGEWLANEIHA